MTKAVAVALLAVICMAGAAHSQPCRLFGGLLSLKKSFRAASANMKPAIEPGQCFLVDTRHGGGKGVAAGDIVAFVNPPTEMIHVSRVVAFGGQTIAIEAGVPMINGVPLEQIARDPYPEAMAPQGPSGLLPRCPSPVAEGETCLIPRLTETLPNGVSYDVLDLGPDGFGDDTPVFAVPKDHLFVLGDHRDNSQDSRFHRDVGGPGFVPLDAVVGIVEVPP